MTILFGSEAKELYNNAKERKGTTPVSGVFEYFDKDGVKYKAFKPLSGELFVNDFNTFEEAVRYINLEV